MIPSLIHQNTLCKDDALAVDFYVASLIAFIISHAILTIITANETAMQYSKNSIGVIMLILI